jgi:hypothetical protein
MEKSKGLRKEDALRISLQKGRPGKIEVVPTKEAKTQRDLSLSLQLRVWLSPVRKLLRTLKMYTVNTLHKGQFSCCYQ